MIPEINNNLDKIIEACKLYNIKSLSVVGSAARAIDFGIESDIDFLFKRKDENTAFDVFDITLGFQDILQKKVDMINEEGIKNKYFLESVLIDSVKLYEA
ncbi:MAG: nucleotidyltransferase family protein [Chitinophagaceae bacterium]